MYKTIIFLCSMYYIIATVNSVENEAIEMETDSPELGKLKIDVPEIDEIKQLSNTLKPVSVINRGRLLTNPSKYYPNYVREVLVDRGWRLEIVDELVGKYKEKKWPAGISTRFARESNKGLIGNYDCRLIPLPKCSEQAVIVFASDNTRMPNEMIANPGFLMIFNYGGIA